MKSDTPYCSVDRNKIHNAKPKVNAQNLYILNFWINERESIRIKKDIQKEPAPWTNDAVLQKYRFCNVRREDDKESRFLIENICNNSGLTYENKILNIILFRLINKSKTFSIFQPLDFNSLNIEYIRARLSGFLRDFPSYVFFSNAFFTSGPKTVANKLFSDENMVIKMIFLANHYKSLGIAKSINSCKSQSEVFSCLLSLPGIGQFLAYQIFVDFTYIENFPFTDKEFTVAGPGCVKGLKLIFDNFDNLSFEESLFWLRDNQKTLFEFNHFPLSVMSLENCMCEFSKYWRAANNIGRPRVKYKSES
jgi:hypothetical protein